MTYDIGAKLPPAEDLIEAVAMRLCSHVGNFIIGTDKITLAHIRTPRGALNFIEGPEHIRAEFRDIAKKVAGLIAGELATKPGLLPLLLCETQEHTLANQLGRPLPDTE